MSVDDRYAKALEAALGRIARLGGDCRNDPGSSRASIICTNSERQVRFLSHRRHRTRPHRGSITPVGTQRLRGLVHTNDRGIAALLDVLIGETLVCSGSFEEAADVVLAHPAITVVTLAGDRFSHVGWRIGAGRDGATRAALDAATGELNRLGGEVTTLSDVRDDAHRGYVVLLDRRRAADRNLDRLNNSLRSLEAALSNANRQLELTRSQVGITQAEIATVDSEATLVGDRVADTQRQLELFETEESAVRERSAAAAEARRAISSSTALGQSAHCVAISRSTRGGTRRASSAPHRTARRVRRGDRRASGVAAPSC